MLAGGTWITGVVVQAVMMRLRAWNCRRFRRAIGAVGRMLR